MTLKLSFQWKKMESVWFTSLLIIHLPVQVAKHVWIANIIVQVEGPEFVYSEFVYSDTVSVHHSVPSQTSENCSFKSSLSCQHKVEDAGQSFSHLVQCHTSNILEVGQDKCALVVFPRPGIALLGQGRLACCPLNWKVFTMTRSRTSNLGISFPGVFGCFKKNHGQVMKSELLFQWSHVSDFYSLLEGE